MMAVSIPRRPIRQFKPPHHRGDPAAMGHDHVGLVGRELHWLRLVGEVVEGARMRRIHLVTGFAILHWPRAAVRAEHPLVPEYRICR